VVLQPHLRHCITNTTPRSIKIAPALDKAVLEKLALEHHTVTHAPPDLEINELCAMLPSPRHRTQLQDLWSPNSLDSLTMSPLSPFGEPDSAPWPAQSSIVWPESDEGDWIGDTNFSDDDCEIVCGESTWRVHSSVLASASPVLHRMMQDAPRQLWHDRTLVLAESSSDAIGTLLEFLYTGQARAALEGVAPKKLLSTLQEAIKYSIGTLVRACIHALIDYVQLGGKEVDMAYLHTVATASRDTECMSCPLYGVKCDWDVLLSQLLQFTSNSDTRETAEYGAGPTGALQATDETLSSSPSKQQFKSSYAKNFALAKVPISVGFLVDRAFSKALDNKQTIDQYDAYYSPAA